MKTKINISLLILIASAAFGSPSFAGSADDAKWIGQCVIDNKDEGQSVDTVQKYCTCMNDKMSDNETQSITQWEKTHKVEDEACSALAGWK